MIFICCSTSSNDKPELPSNAKVEYFIEYEIDGKKEKYIIDTGHLNNYPSSFVLPHGLSLVYVKTFDASNFAGPTGGAQYPILPFGKSVYTQTIYPNFSLTLTMRNFSAIKSGDILQVDSCSLYEPFGNAVGLTYVPKPPPFNDSSIDYYDLGLNPLIRNANAGKFLSKNIGIMGKNGKIKILSKTYHTVKNASGGISDFFVISGEINGDFMKYKVTTKDGFQPFSKVNKGYRSGSIKFQLPFIPSN